MEFVWCHFLVVLDQTGLWEQIWASQRLQHKQKHKIHWRLQQGEKQLAATKAAFLRRGKRLSHCSQTAQIFSFLLRTVMQTGWLFFLNRNVTTMGKSIPDCLSLLSLVARKLNLTAPSPSDMAPIQSLQLYCKFPQVPTCVLQLWNNKTEQEWGPKFWSLIIFSPH